MTTIAERTLNTEILSEMNLRRSLIAIRQHPRAQQVLRPVRARVVAIDKAARSRMVAFTRTRFGRPLFYWYVKRKNAYTAQPIALDGGTR